MKKIVKVLVLVFIIIILISGKTVARYFYPLKYSTYISEYSNQYNIDPYLVAAVIKTESGFDEDAISNKCAYGLMQITPDTAKWAAEKMNIINFNNSMLMKPEFNIKMGCWYINDLNDEFKGNIEVMLAAYNGGRGNVKKWLKDNQHSIDGENLHHIPFKETEKYVKRVKMNYNIYKYLYKGKFNQ